MRRYGILALLALVVLIAPTSNALAFDGSRGGFILGLGGGYGHMFAISQDARAISVQGLLTEVVLGYGISDQWLVHYSGRQIWEGTGGDGGNFRTAIFPSLAVTYFNRPSSRSFYEMGSLGFATAGDVNLDEEGTGSIDGPAAFVGIGYETTKHFGFELVGGVLSSDNGTYGTVGLTMKVLAY